MEEEWEDFVDEKLPADGDDDADCFQIFSCIWVDMFINVISKHLNPNSRNISAIDLILGDKIKQFCNF